METCECQLALFAENDRCGPHSLGKSVEWKQTNDTRLVERAECPHSLGKSVEWKHQVGKPFDLHFVGPHSLGKSVEWKLFEYDLYGG